MVLRDALLGPGGLYVWEELALKIVKLHRINERDHELGKRVSQVIYKRG